MSCLCFLLNTVFCWLWSTVLLCRNVLKVTIEVPWAGELNVWCTQLDHLDEDWRMKQIDAITQGDESPHILLGGLNSLDGSDYSIARWNHIVKVYIR